MKSKCTLASISLYYGDLPTSDDNRRPTATLQFTSVSLFDRSFTFTGTVLCMELHLKVQTQEKKPKMNDDTLPLYPGHEQVSSLPLQKINDVVVNEPKEQSTQSTSPVFTRNVTLVGPENALVTCPFCQTMVRTTIKHTSTTRTHFLAMRCLLLCCCCIPYCCDSARNTDHYCPACLRFIGTYEK